MVVHRNMHGLFICFLLSLCTTCLLLLLFSSLPYLYLSSLPCFFFYFSSLHVFCSPLLFVSFCASFRASSTLSTLSVHAAHGLRFQRQKDRVRSLFEGWGWCGDGGVCIVRV
ncbi:hypothetical protein C7974DRAFT_391605 [Boeremia exigua]|uniref:uncharacterized protein n=1 Tax=Boeremia exigua TaxID=749465 RepID=UPI001E8ECAC9|nr:uncharacterized protein C7974DRAFT_391605 [Boeremia exigua]KAH6638438.1 hypothetical protein C7974DRAFT_391605 [Boeremia exigua]